MAALDRPVTTSPRPPTLATGAISAVICTTCIGWPFGEVGGGSAASSCSMDEAMSSLRLSEGTGRGDDLGERSQKGIGSVGEGQSMPFSRFSLNIAADAAVVEDASIVR